MEAIVCVMNETMTVGKNGTVKAHLPRKVPHVCTARERYLVDLRRGRVRAVLRYSGTIFRGFNFSWI